MLERVHRDIYQNRTDMPQVSADARKIEARTQFLLQSQAAALRRGLRTTPDSFQRAAVEQWPLHVYEAAAHALNMWQRRGEGAARIGRRAPHLA
eukprot:2612017-Pyramimonas_sp.AAC.1